MLDSKKPLTSSGLRTTATVTMVLDHLGPPLIEKGLIQSTGYFILRGIGRLSFPLFVFLMVEGVYHTRSQKKYLGRLLGAALISQPFFSYYVLGVWLDFNHWNTIVNLFLGALSLAILETTHTLLKRIGGVVGVFTLALICELGGVDYGVYGIVLAVLFYSLRDVTNQPYQGSIWGTVIYHLVLPFSIQTLGLGSSLFLSGYNGQKGRTHQWLGYGFYPLHLLILGLWRWA